MEADQEKQLEMLLVDYADQHARAADIERAVLKFSSNAAVVDALLTGFQKAVQESAETFLELNKLGITDRNAAILAALKIKDGRAANG